MRVEPSALNEDAESGLKSLNKFWVPQSHFNGKLGVNTTERLRAIM